MKFRVGESEKEIEKSISFQSFPNELYKEGIWGHFAFVNDKEHGVRVICSAYNTDRYSPGTVVVSNKIFNEFPIAQSAWNMNNQISRMYVDPFYRSKKLQHIVLLQMTCWQKNLDMKYGLLSIAKRVAQ